MVGLGSKAKRKLEIFTLNGSIWSPRSPVPFAEFKERNEDLHTMQRLKMHGVLSHFIAIGGYIYNFKFFRLAA